MTRHWIPGLKHGHSPRGKASPTYQTWKKMRSRCERQGDPSYQQYGARGILVCERWKSFEKFLADMGERPAGTTIDRIDNNRGYEAGNCRWATKKEQSQNSRTPILITFNGKTQCIADWERDLGVKQGTVYFRLRRGWTVADALTTQALPRSSRTKRTAAPQTTLRPLR